MLKTVVTDYASLAHIFLGNNTKYYYYVIDFLRLLILIHVVAPTNDTQTRSKKKKNYILFTCSMFTKPDDPDIRRLPFLPNLLILL